MVKKTKKNIKEKELKKVSGGAVTARGLRINPEGPQKSQPRIEH